MRVSSNEWNFWECHVIKGMSQRWEYVHAGAALTGHNYQSNIFVEHKVFIYIIWYDPFSYSVK